MALSILDNLGQLTGKHFLYVLISIARWQMARLQTPPVLTACCQA